MRSRARPWTVLILLLALTAAGRAGAGEEARPGITLTYVSPEVEVSFRLPWLAEVPDLLARLRHLALGRLGRFAAEWETPGKEPELFPRPGRMTHEETVEIRHLGPRLVSLRTTIVEYTGGAHPNGWFETWIWDRRAGRRLDVFDLFDRDCLLGSERLFAALDAALREAKRARDWLEPGDDPRVPRAEESFAAVTLEGGPDGYVAAVTLHFAPYALGAYAEGSYALRVPAALVRACVRPGFRDRFR